MYNPIYTFNYLLTNMLVLFYVIRLNVDYVLYLIASSKLPLKKSVSIILCYPTTCGLPTLSYFHLTLTISYKTRDSCGNVEILGYLFNLKP